MNYIIIKKVALIYKKITNDQVKFIQNYFDIIIKPWPNLDYSLLIKNKMPNQ